MVRKSIMFPLPLRCRDALARRPAVFGSATDGASVANKSRPSVRSRASARRWWSLPAVASSVKARWAFMKS
eukprot:8319217-Alexandrium_andersonii.AAC.1